MLRSSNGEKRYSNNGIKADEATRITPELIRPTRPPPDLGSLWPSRTLQKAFSLTTFAVLF
jgi:hypothetical protein